MPSNAIILWGFDWDTQKQIKFNQTWRAAFLDRQYTDEEHESTAWAWNDQGKKREIKYGNNIAVLFRALYQCRHYYAHSENFWTAIATGWKTKAPVLEELVSKLTEARRLRRHENGREPSQTAQAADHWIDFLDSEASRLSRPHHADTRVFQVAKDFYDSMAYAMVNAARVPHGNSKPAQSLLGSHWVQDPRSPPIKSEDNTIQEEDWGRLLRYSRKRSASPISAQSPTSKRPHHETREPSRREEPARPVQPVQNEPYKRQTSLHSLASPRMPRRESEHSNISAKPQEKPNGTQSVSTCPQKPESEGSSVLKEGPGLDLAALENKLVETERQLKDTAAMSQVNQVTGEIKEDLKSLKTITGSLAESMGMIADHVEVIREDLSVLKKQQDGEAHSGHPVPDQMETVLTLLRKATEDVASLKAGTDARLQQHEQQQLQEVTSATSNNELMQEIMSNVKTLMGDVSELKSQQTQAIPTPPAALQQQDIQVQMEGLFRDQNAHIERLTREMANMQGQMASLAAAGRSTNPQTLRQAMGLAEQDLKLHRDTIHRFYNRLDPSRGANLETTSKVADCLIAMDQTLATVHAATGPR